MQTDFHTSREEHVLQLEVRKKLYGIVQEFAGSHFRAIERRSKLATGTVKYHLDYLVKYGLVSSVKEGHSLRYFPRGFQPSNKKLLGLLRQKSVRKILLFVLMHNSCNHDAIVQNVDLGPSTVSWHLRKLEGGKVISSARNGRNTLFSLIVDKEELVKLLITYQESFFDTMVDNVVEMWEL